MIKDELKITRLKTILATLQLINNIAIIIILILTLLGFLNGTFNFDLKINPQKSTSTPTSTLIEYGGMPPNTYIATDTLF